MSWTTEGLCGLSVVSMCSTGAAEGIWKSKVKDPCPVKFIWPFAASELSEGRNDSSASAGTLSGRKLNLKLLSLLDQSGLSVLPVREADPSDLGVTSVREEIEF